MDIYVRIKYTERIMRGPELIKYQQFLAECKESEKGIAGYQWSLELEK